MLLLETAESLVKDGGKSWYNPDQFMAQYQIGQKIVADIPVCIWKSNNCWKNTYNQAHYTECNYIVSEYNRIKHISGIKN